MVNEPIAAIATPPGRGGIGIVRISGARLPALLQALVHAEVEPRRATRAEFYGADAHAIDQGLVLFFPGPRSYTGEDVIELHAHGSPLVLQSLLARCIELGARIAEPGEFTRRAFLNGKLDLAQAEGVADLINATTVEAARCAMRSLQGEFSQQIDLMVQALIELRMLVEARLDFPEDDVDFLEHQVRTRLARVRKQLSRILAASRQGSLLRDGLQVVLAGAPNVGKSSLLNRLVGAERAIVTHLPGTTRDAIGETVSIQGVPMHIIDTAGLRESDDMVEKLGISKTWDAISRADLVLWVSDVTRPETRVPDPELAARMPPRIAQLHVINKIDLTEITSGDHVEANHREVALSAKTGVGIDVLKTALLDAIGWTNEGEGLYMARARHLEALQGATLHLTLANALAAESELFAEELRLAQQALASITGEFTADDLLGKIFSQFCIGK